MIRRQGRLRRQFSEREFMKTSMLDSDRSLNLSFDITKIMSSVYPRRVGIPWPTTIIIINNNNKLTAKLEPGRQFGSLLAKALSVQCIA